MSPSPATPGKGDPYTYGGIAEGTGGARTKTSYATDNQSTDPLSATETGKAGRIDQPRNPVTAAPGTSSTSINLSAGGGGAKPGATSTPPVKKP